MVCAEKVKEKLNTRTNIHRVRPYLAKPAVCKKNRPKGLCVPKEQQQRKSYTNVIQGGARLHPKQAVELNLTAAISWFCF